MPLDNGIEIAEGGIFPWPVLNLLQMGDLGGDTSDVDGTAVVMSSNMMGCTGPKDGGGDGAGISFRISSQLLEPSDSESSEMYFLLRLEKNPMSL